MFIYYKKKFPALAQYWDKFAEFQKRLELPARHILMEEGRISKYYYYIEKGAVRAFLNNKGVDRTVQFFFEGDGMSSFESFMRGTPSAFGGETLEPTVLLALPKQKVLEMMEELKQVPEFLDMFIYIFSDRQIHYMHEFVSLLKDTPTERYEKLIAERPHILQRVAQHHIASYLGVSSVHLSRIKAKLAKNQRHF